MLHNVVRWFRMHFGGRLKLSSVESYTKDGSVWFGSNERYLVISYKGITRAWDKGMLQHFGSLMEAYHSTIAFLVACEGQPICERLYRMKPKDFEELQCKHGLSFKMVSFVRLILNV